MFEKITPEQAGISSVAVKAFIEKLEKRGAYRRVERVVPYLEYDE